jgi:hypothetical protein
MSSIDVDKILFRAHRVGDIMGASKNQITDKQLTLIDELSAKRNRTEKQESELQRLIDKRDNPNSNLSETCKTYLRELFLSVKYQREKIISSKYLEKGLRHEENALTLLSVVKDAFLKKNKTRLSNRYISGLPDTFQGESIQKAKRGYDTKVCWSLWTMPDPKEPLDPQYEFQNHSYNALTGAEQWSTTYCLVNADAMSIRLEKERTNNFYADEDGNRPDDNPSHPSYDEYMNRLIEIEKNMIFDMKLFKERNPIDYHDSIILKGDDWKFDIPKEQRVVEFVTPRDSMVIQEMYDKIEDCRKWIKDNLV